MSTVSLRLPNYLHAKVRELAQQENVSINQFIVLAVAEKISALVTEDYLAERASRGSRDKFERAMAQVATGYEPQTPQASSERCLGQPAQEVTARLSGLSACHDRILWPR